MRSRSALRLSSKLAFNMMKLSVLIFLSCPLAAFAVDGSRACADEDSHVGQRACLVSAFEKVAAQLTQVETECLEQIEQWDEDAVYRVSAKKAILSANAAFQKYRASQCGFMHSLAAGGNGATDRQLQCSIELTNQRISQLRNSVLGLKPR